MELNILLLCNRPNVGNDADTIIEHISAFEDYSQNKIWTLSHTGNLPLELDLNKFDVIIIHYSLCLLNNYYLSDVAKKRLSDFNGLKVVFIQDEYREINKMIRILSFLNIDIIFSCFPDSEIHKIYKTELLPTTSKYNNLTGYISEKALLGDDAEKVANRTIDVGYRARKLPFWYGELSYEKWDIVEQWKKHTDDKLLITDISYHEADRIYGTKWVEFLSSCKTTLGVESGASVMDFTGELERKINLHQLMYPNDSFFDVQKKFLKDDEGKHKLNQISPRCFEAITHKTVLILYQGEYSGILTPGRHYIELKKDFSNINQVVKYIRDDEYLQNMADTAYKEIALNPNYSYQGFINYVDKIIEREFKLRGKETVLASYLELDYLRDIKTFPIRDKVYHVALKRYKKLPLLMQKIIKLILRPKNIVQLLSFRLINIIPRTKNDEYSS